ncbi:MAG: aldehyde dehydrogenase family protein, partial [Candidatus Levyibacteriota bacterium]
MDASDLQRAAAIPRSLYIGGAWQAPRSGRSAVTLDPGSGASLGEVAMAGEADVAAAVAAAREGFRGWRAVAPLERARILRRVA